MVCHNSHLEFALRNISLSSTPAHMDFFVSFLFAMNSSKSECQSYILLYLSKRNLLFTCTNIKLQWTYRGGFRWLPVYGQLKVKDVTGIFKQR